MSASYMKNCAGCGLQYEVIELEYGWVAKVDGVVEQDCPKCDSPLKPGEPLADVPALVEE
jgi:hypothetical protein